ncbi:MAG: hypothetical protein ACTSWK_04135 [Promethearchaeota archaeon]
MAIKINAKDCCGSHCQIDADARKFNISVESIEEEILAEERRSNRNDRSNEWPDE